MKKSLSLPGLLLAMLFLAACAPAANDVASQPVVGEAGVQDVSVLVYASPL